MNKKGVVFHLDLNDVNIFQLCINNIKNFLPYAKGKEVAVVANGTAVKLFLKDSSEEFKDDLEELVKNGVKFFVCSKAIFANKIEKSKLFNFCEIVPAGIAKIVELQEEGYIYIKP
ncbi:MAG: hypothetical protein GXO57_04465 [Thermodesulfobacteria bacterium]|nr:hypothetical protein [Thermodesulfobacteriota bacterium]